MINYMVSKNSSPHFDREFWKRMKDLSEKDSGFKIMNIKQHLL